MSNAGVEVRELVEAAAAVTPMFVAAPSQPVEVARAADLVGASGREVTRRYRAHGYALMEFASETVTEALHLQAAQAFRLGDPFVPPLYFLGGRTPSSVSVISAAENDGTSDETHPSFGRTVGQELHCDGTLQPIGLVKATLMSCRTPAAVGGDNTLFDSVAAFSALLRADPAAALALAHPEALVRRATINGSDEACSGPVYGVVDGRLAGRYCVTDTDSFGSVGGAADDLARGVSALAASASPGQPYFRTLRLGANQAIMFDNTRVSHGRTSYEDAKGSQRCLYRTLHLRHPDPMEAGGPE